MEEWRKADADRIAIFVGQIRDRIDSRRIVLRHNGNGQRRGIKARVIVCALVDQRFNAIEIRVGCIDQNLLAETIGHEFDLAVSRRNCRAAKRNWLAVDLGDRQRIVVRVVVVGEHGRHHGRVLRCRHEIVRAGRW